MTKVDSSLVAHLPLFTGFSAADLDSILSEARSVRFAKNASVFSQGEEAHSFYVLLHGHVRASKTTPAGEQIVVRYVATGETFGVAKAIGLQRYPATATAVDDSVALACRPGPGPGSSRNSRRLPPIRFKQSAPAFRKPTPA
jgi:CRP/FNR family transcriptional regulator, nitrogen oxide reductase regulator